jgi:trimeric autotransporter adhesin
MCYICIRETKAPHLMRNKIACLQVIIFAFTTLICTAQSPINMSLQPSFRYTENFADISNWTFNANADGTFTAGVGASAWKGNPAGGTGTIPTATRLTVSSTNFQVSGNPNQGSSSGFYRGTQNINLISTGTTNNTSSIAIDLFLNFTGVNAGTLSFDWASLNNSSGDRAGSLRIYTSIDKINFTELAAASVLNFINNSPTNGTISFVQLPSNFNNKDSAIIRFYYHNGTGGTTGSRPRISVDNISVTATPTTICTTPTAQPTNLIFSNITTNSLQGVFAAAAPAPQGYLVLMSQSNQLSVQPTNNNNYSVGDNIGDATVVHTGAANSYNVGNLNSNTRYYFYVFSMNNLCSGGPLYLLSNSLQANTNTLTGNEPCTTPTNPATNLVLSNIKSSSISGSFAASANATHYLVLKSTSATLSSNPVNGNAYNIGTNIGNATVVKFSTAISFTANNLASGTQYYFHVIAANNQNCIGGPSYFTSSIISASTTTTSIPVCAEPTSAVTNLQVVADSKYINGYFKASTSADGYLVLVSTANSLSVLPSNNTNYIASSTIGNATVVNVGAATSFFINNLVEATNYTVFIVAYNSNCTGGTKYLVSNITQASTTTLATSTANIYYGNLHAHSSFSDGNQDNPTFTPANNYAFAKNSLCLDFLGISEHNHSSAGMNISNWQPGINQAAAATTSSFLGLYGMEWGVISGGGHVLVFGSNDLLGWESGNFNRFVAKSDYTGIASANGNDGLFATINRMGNNAVALLAHPNNSDYNNLSNSTFNLVADSAVVGAALANGPSTSTNISYSNPGSSLAYYDYYKKMLARGYHIAPSIDHDNHNTTFGRTAYSRLAVIAPSLSQNTFLAALKSRKFYATEDCDSRVIFTINNQPMGSVLNGATPPALSVYTIDPTNASSIPNIKIMYGIPGSSILPEAIDSINAYTFNFTHFILPNNTTAYYYAEITIDGNKIITAPIRYTYNDPNILPVNLLSFSGQMLQSKALLQWQTSNEINNQHFVIQKSADGVFFSKIDSVEATNNAALSNYQYVDPSPFVGTNFYRLQQVDKDGTSTYSTTIQVFNAANFNTVQVLQNPIQQNIILSINSNVNQLVQIFVTDIAGKKLLQQQQSLVNGKQQLSISNTLQRGSYVLQVIGTNWQSVHKIVK